MKASSNPEADDEALAEPLRRIREAKDTRATGIDLSRLESLKQLPRELERLTSLQTLYLSETYAWAKSR
jgi:hypothetical protein